MIAGEALIPAVAAALARVGAAGGVHDGAPLQAAFPHLVVEVGPETDWGHKSGEGRELRLAVTVRDHGERPARLRRLMGEAVAALGDVGAGVPGWQIVTLRFLRSRIVRELRGSEGLPVWAGVIEFRARMLAAEA